MRSGLRHLWMNIRVRALVAALGLWVASGGCASTPLSRFGSFVNLGVASLAFIATDACNKLRQTYPAEETFVRLTPGERDQFGRVLGTALRQASYRVVPSVGEAADAVELSFVLDALKGTQAVRLELRLPRGCLSRVYRQGTRGWEPAGPWSSSSGGTNDE